MNRARATFFLSLTMIERRTIQVLAALGLSLQFLDRLGIDLTELVEALSRLT